MTTFKTQLRTELLILDALLTWGDPVGPRRVDCIEDFLAGEPYYLSDGGESYVFIEHLGIEFFTRSLDDFRGRWFSNQVTSVRNRINGLLRELHDLNEGHLVEAI